MKPSSLPNQIHIHPLLITGLIFLIAITVRFVYLFELRDNPLFDVFPTSLDHFNMDQSAQNFAEGDLLARAVNNSFAPLYRYFLGILYWIFGRNLTVIYGIQFMMGAFSCVLIYWIGKELFGIRTGILAALGLAFYTTHIIYEGILLRAAFISFLGVLLFFSSHTIG